MRKQISFHQGVSGNAILQQAVAHLNLDLPRIGASRFVNGSVEIVTPTAGYVRKPIVLPGGV
jgi:hypothetical protein